MLVRETPLELQRMRTTFPGICMRLIDTDNRCYLPIAHEDEHKPFASKSHLDRVHSDLNGSKYFPAYCE